MSDGINVFDDAWQEGYPQKEGYRANYKRLKAGDLAVAVYELLPGQTQCPYHFHDNLRREVARGDQVPHRLFRPVVDLMPAFASLRRTEPHRRAAAYVHSPVCGVSGKPKKCLTRLLPS